MLPWDYDGCFGSFPPNAVVSSFVDSKDVVNAGIDSPLGIIKDEDRPMWNWILSDKTYLKEYHDVLAELTDVIGLGEYEKEAGRVYDLILPYIDKDKKTPYSSDRFIKAKETLIQISELRAKSIHRQLSGQLPARSEDQAEEDKVDTSGIFIKDMGSAHDAASGN